ncbi:MAG: DUF1573 domain-containing protein [Rikenellaceae bacterium]
MKGLLSIIALCGALCGTTTLYGLQPSAPLIDTVSMSEPMCDSLKELCSKYAVLKADSLSYNAGIVNYKREVKHEFSVTNIGSQPLIVYSLRTGSSSMKAKITRRPLKPGQSAKLRVEYEISKMPLGEFMRNIELTTNSCGGSMTVFTLAGHSTDKSGKLVEGVTEATSTDTQRASQ